MATAFVKQKWLKVEVRHLDETFVTGWLELSSFNGIVNFVTQVVTPNTQLFYQYNLKLVFPTSKEDSPMNYHRCAARVRAFEDIPKIISAAEIEVPFVSVEDSIAALLSNPNTHPLVKEALQDLTTSASAT